MRDIINEIYELANKPIVTPYNLIANSKLPNYEYVKYYKWENGIISEMKCNVDDIDTIFEYYFDEKDHLVKINMNQEGQSKEVFNREDELNKIRTEYITNNADLIVKIG